MIYSATSASLGNKGEDKNLSPYAFTKAKNLELLENLKKWFNFKYEVIYFYNVYGKREIRIGKYATLIALFTEKMKNDETLTIVSPGTQKRNFTHVDDIIDGLVLVGENGYGDEFGIGSRESFSILEVAQLFGGEIQILPERKGNRMTADVVTAKTEALGWSPKRNLAVYIEVLKSNDWNK